MKVLLTTLNSKYVQSNLAIRYLRSYCQELPVEIDLREFNINQRLDYVLAEIYLARADVVAFSCYIWNLFPTLYICENLKKIAPQTKIVLGGPEVSFDPVHLVDKYPYLDYIIYGEGEETFDELLKALLEGQPTAEIPGLVTVGEGKVYTGPERALITDLDTIPSPFLSNLEELEHKLVYYESSRGCPFNCQYCLSSTLKGVRTFSMERIKSDLMQLIKAEVRQVKFVDRTFNYKPERALEIMMFLYENRHKTGFHFEITAHLITDEILEFLCDIPPGLFQFEIGVQTTHGPTLEQIRRVDDFARLTKVVEVLRTYENIHLHLDLIAGLPKEDYKQFQKSFNAVFLLKPDKLQLGFLKLLKGSGIREKAEENGYIYLVEPPYELLANKWLSYDQLLELKQVEELLEIFYNSHKFEMSIEYIISHYAPTDPFSFFLELKEVWESRGYNHAPVKDVVLYKLLVDFCAVRMKEELWIVKEFVKYDFLRNNRTSNLPDWLNSIEVKDYKERVYQYVNDQESIQRDLPHLQHLEGRQILRRILIEPFGFDLFSFRNREYQGEPGDNKIFVLFDYDSRDPIFGQIHTKCIQL